ncbi:MAG: site-specific DNA-methyltransferase [Elusimicrobiota bacterium]|jgi:site-specific DNA-methyltransferase (adenine-specific)|nr:site-specific DNA-methyltransferase [Elusimicrobiota bacterium]
MSISTSTQTSNFGISKRENHDSSKFYNSKLYKDLEKKTDIKKKENTLSDDVLNRLFCKSSETMDEIKDNSIHLIITSPPYNVSKEYDKDLSLDEYLELLKRVFSESFRILVNGGRLCVNLANIGRKPYIPLTDYVSRIMNYIGFNMRGEIIWNKGATASPSTAWGSWMSASNPILRDVHEYILIFSKGDYNRIKGNKRNTIKKSEFMELTKSIWDINAVSAKRIGHPAPYPEELANRLIKLYSFENDIVLDPFIGSGTTAIAAIKNKRKYIGYDIEQKYINLAMNRIDKEVGPFLI